MIIKINDDRGFETQTLYFGYLEENNSTTIEFEFPEYLEKYNKKLNFMLADGTTVCKLFDDINSNKFTFTRDLLKFNKLQMAIEFFDTNENLIYRTSILTIRISDSIICDDDVSPEDSKVVILNELIQKVTELDTQVTENEATRQSNEETRVANENTRINNENAREEYIKGLKKDVELGNFDGATFTPHVSESGDLSWSNNKNLSNPETVNIKGEKGDKGQKGDTGAPFRIVKTYPSVEAMQADFDNMEVGDYVMITSSIELEDNAKLYCKTETEWVYITDFSGATGIQGEKGEKGDKGDKGEKGDTGVGISKLEVIDGALYVTLTNNVKENAGVILTDEVKSWLVSQITDNAESDFNEYYNSKVEEFNTNATEKTTAYNNNAEDKLSEYNTNATNKINEYNTNAEAILKILPNKTTEVQENIDIDDAAESSFNKLDVYGNSRQESTEGYNLFDIDSVTDTILDISNGKEISSPGWRTSNFIEIQPLNSYLFSIKYEGILFQMNYGFYDNNKSFISGYNVQQHNIYKATIETPENAMFIKLSYSVNVSGNPVPRNEIMFIKGIEEKPYEPYTGGNPSPNPDYPQEIESIKDSITFKRINANLLDINDLYTETTINGVNIKYNNDGTLTLKGTATGQIQLALRTGGNLKNGDYSFKNFGSPSTIATNIYYIGDVYGETVRSFSITEEHNYAIVYVIPIKTTINATIKPMLVKGKHDDNTFPEFQQYKEENYTLPVQQEMLEDDYIKDVEYHTWGKIILTGNENNWNWNPENQPRVKLLIDDSEIKTLRQVIISNYFKYTGTQLIHRVGIGFIYNKFLFLYYPENISNLDDWKSWLQEKYNSGNPVVVYYKLNTPIELPCTPEQTAILNQLEQFSLSKGINHIFSDDELSPKFKLMYYQDMNILLDKTNEKTKAE